MMENNQEKADYTGSRGIFAGLPGSPWFWRLAFFLLLTGAGLLGVLAALDSYKSVPMPVGDAREYFDQARSLSTGNLPEGNIWLSRWPAMSMLLSMIWRLTGVTSLVQYLLGSAALLATALIIFILAMKRSGLSVAVASLIILLFQPAILQTASLGLSEPLFTLLALLLLVSGYLLEDRPYFYLLPAVIILSLFVLCKEESRYLAVIALILFSVRYYRAGRFSIGILIALSACVLTALCSLYFYSHYLEQNNLVPMKYRIGAYYFFKEFLQGKEPYNSVNRCFNMMTFFDWLRLHSPEELFRLLLHGLSNARLAFDSLLFPGASFIFILGLLFSAFSNWTLEFLFLLPLAGFYPAAFAYSSEPRFLFPFCCLGLPAALDGWRIITRYVLNRLKPGFHMHLDGTVPLVFCFITLFYGYMPVKVATATGSEEKLFPDQSIAQVYIGVLLEQERFAEADDSLAAGLARNPNWSLFHLERGITSYAAGRKKEAFEHLDKSISLTPYTVETYYVAYYLLARDGQNEKAVTYLERSIKYRPEFPMIRDLLEHIYKDSGKVETIENLNRKGPFNYYLQHPLLYRAIRNQFAQWINFLQNHFPFTRQ
jgi:tetratricopeptide (TPR) repeat protein